MTTIYGDNSAGNFAVCICTGKSGSGTTATPDTAGTALVYFDCKKVDYPLTSKIKVSDLASGSTTSVATGKKSYGVTLTDIIIKKWSTYTLTEAMNLITSFIRTYQRTAASRVYMFIWNRNDAKYLYLSQLATSGADQNFIYGRIMDAKPSMENVYMINSLFFKEC